MQPPLQNFIVWTGIDAFAEYGNKFIVTDALQGSRVSSVFGKLGGLAASVAMMEGILLSKGCVHYCVKPLGLRANLSASQFRRRTAH